MPRADAPSDAASLGEWMERQYGLSAAAMLQSISAVDLVKTRPAFGQVIRAARGSVIASPALASYDPDPDYFFHWLRDSAVVIDALRILIEDGAEVPDARDRIKDFVRFSLALGALDGRVAAKAEGVVAPEFRQYLRPRDELSAAFGDTILGEARFNADGTLDITKWARPQHDGPALRALVVMRLWRMGVFDEAGIREAARTLIEGDLAFTYRRWREPSFDLWEEERAQHYYTRLVQHAALSDGADWIEQRGDRACADAYRAAAGEIRFRLDEHWSPTKGFYLSRVEAMAGNPDKELDIAVILGVVHAQRIGDIHSVLDPKARATLTALERLFAGAYPINRDLPAERGVAMGRYAGDRYYSGGAYYFSTLGAAEFCYRAANMRAAQLVGADEIDAWIDRGDRFMATVCAYAPASGELSEQFDQATGQQTSAKNLAWSHAALITAVASRRAACRARDRTG